jgi:hypothetical protein
MLKVGPGSGMVPVRESFFALTTSTLLLAVSKANTVALSGDIAMRPGEVPVPISDASVSVSPSITTRPGREVGLETLCEARTRAVSLLGLTEWGEYPPPQDTELKLASASGARNRAAFFKRQAPNYRKTGDLTAK